MTPNQSLFSSRMTPFCFPGHVLDPPIGSLGHVIPCVTQHVGHGLVALGVSAELTLGAVPVDSAPMREGDGDYQEGIFPALRHGEEVVPGLCTSAATKVTAKTTLVVQVSHRSDARCRLLALVW